MRKIIRRETKELGELRTSQLITSFGVGAIVDFRDETAILGGADDWYRNPEEDKARVLRCHNLEKILRDLSWYADMVILMIFRIHYGYTVVNLAKSKKVISPQN